MNSETEKKYEFLKKDPWDGFGFEFDQLVYLYDRTLEITKEEEIEENGEEEIDEDEIEEIAKDYLKLDIQKMKKGGMAMGEGVVFGITMPFDYINMWRNKQIRQYKGYLKENRTKARKMITDQLIRIDKDAKGNKTIVALDKRKPGIPYPDSGNIASFVSVWKCSLDKKLYVAFPTLGGEFGDEEVNPICPKCGNESFLPVCNKTIKKTINGKKKRAVCDQKRSKRFRIPEIMDNIGKLSTFSLKLKIKDKLIEDIDWGGKDTVITPGKELTLRFVKDKETKKRELKGTMLKWIPKERIVTSKEIYDAWSKDKCMLGKESQKVWDKYGGKAVFYICRVYELNQKEYYGKRSMWCSDNSTQGDDQGLQVQVGTHVYEYCMKNKIGEYSMICVVGKLGRIQEKDFKTKQYKWEEMDVIDKETKQKKKKKFAVYNKPHIDAACVIGIIAKKPKIEDTDDIDKIDIDLDEGENVVIKEEEIDSEELDEFLSNKDDDLLEDEPDTTLEDDTETKEDDVSDLEVDDDVSQEYDDEEFDDVEEEE